MGCFQQNFCTFSMRWVLFFKKLSVFFVQGGYFFVGFFCVCFPKGGCHLHRIFLYFSARWVSFKRIFFCILVSKWVVSLSLISLYTISSLSANTNLIVGNLLWKVFNHYHLSSARALFTNWLIEVAGLSVQLVDLWSMDVYTIYVAMMKSIHTTLSNLCFYTLKFM